jgi:general secretion pathway protein M
VALVLLGGYAFLWDPYVNATARLQQEVAERRALVEWMETSAQEVRGLSGSLPANRGSQSLLALADGTARAQGLGPALQRVEPDGQRGVRVWLEQAPFDDVLRWLDKLVLENGVAVTAFTAERRPEAGRVNVRIVLEGGG